MEMLKKICLIISVYLISLVCEVYNFNFDTKFPIIYENPGAQNNLFGYSVILYEGGSGIDPWIQIGAPKFFNTTDNKETGHVYRCGIKKSCDLLSMPIAVEVSGAALGNSMDISADGSLFAVCGHRYIHQGNSQDYYSKGFCHWGNTNENRTEQRVPLQSDIYSVTADHGGKKIYEYGQAQAGFSLHIATIKNTTEIILGAPGVRNWAGTAILWNEKNDESVPASRRMKRSSAIKLNNFLVSIGQPSPVTHLSLFGYSVTSGYFVDKKRLDYAAGAPRVNMIGEVVVFEFNTGQPTIKKIGPSFKGTQYGEYYGGSLASADLNGDGYTDLIVGAPTFKDNKYNEGKIYIYYGGQQMDSSSKYSIVGKQRGGQFGDTVASLGDIDFDGYEDIAVAATYEHEGQGTVYIYRGSQDGIDINVAQAIKGKDYIPMIKGFGHSISRPRDVDGNGYNDMAIGAYKSEQALIFRARPVITLKHKFDNENIKIETGVKSFDISFSVYYTTNQVFENSKLILIPEFTIDVLHGRVFLKDSPAKIELEGPGIKAHQTYNIQVKTPVSNVFQPINYNLTYKLEEPELVSQMIVVEKSTTKGNDAFCKSCPVFDPKTRQFAEGLASFNLGCNNDQKCYSKLHMTTLFKGIEEGKNVFTIGSKQYLQLVTKVSNTGDKAYLTMLSITLPTDPKITLRSVPPTCKETDAKVTCTIANPLENNEEKTVELELDMAEINERANADLLFTVSVSTISENSEESSQNVILSARKKANITVTGRSKDEYYTFDNTSSVVEFAQVLQVQKEGPSFLDNVLIEVDVPIAYDTTPFIEMYQPTLALKGQPIVCGGEKYPFIEKSGQVDGLNYESKSRRRRNAAEDVTQKFQHFTGFYVNCSDLAQGLKCEKLYCHTGSVHRDVVEIQFRFRMNITNIPPNVLGESDVIVFRTNFHATIMDNDFKPKENYQSQVTLSSVLVGPNVEKMIPIWIIIVAVLCGVLVLAVIAAVLYKFGFFKRDKKDLLEEMKAENEATEATHLDDFEEE